MQARSRLNRRLEKREIPPKGRTDIPVKGLYDALKEQASMTSLETEAQHEPEGEAEPDCSKLESREPNALPSIVCSSPAFKTHCAWQCIEGFSSHLRCAPMGRYDGHSDRNMPIIDVPVPTFAVVKEISAVHNDF